MGGWHGEPASSFPSELFLEALALLTRKPEAALCLPVPHAIGMEGASQSRGCPSPHLTPTSTWKSCLISRPHVLCEMGVPALSPGLRGWAVSCRLSPTPVRDRKGPLSGD